VFYLAREYKKLEKKESVL